LPDDALDHACPSATYLDISVDVGAAAAAIFEMAAAVDGTATDAVAEYLTAAGGTAGTSSGGNAGRGTIAARRASGSTAGLTTLPCGTLVTDVALRAGMRVRLTPPFGRALDAEINGVWTDETDGRQHIGIRLLDPNGWFAE
jgi:hypothetical protein